MKSEDITDWIIDREECSGYSFEKEKKADEMFEELGYEKKDLNTQNIQWYIKKLFKNNYTQIIFDITDKTVATSNNKNEAINLDIQELQAINKKCQELGWIE